MILGLGGGHRLRVPPTGVLVVAQLHADGVGVAALGVDIMLGAAVPRGVCHAHAWIHRPALGHAAHEKVGAGVEGGGAVGMEVGCVGPGRAGGTHVVDHQVGNGLGPAFAIVLAVTGEFGVDAAPGSGHAADFAFAVDPLDPLWGQKVRGLCFVKKGNFPFFFSALCSVAYQIEKAGDLAHKVPCFLRSFGV